MWNDYGSSASAGNGFDVAFLQEVMYATCLPELVDALQAQSGKTWDYVVDVQDETSWDQDVILLGDHNRSATSNYWDELTDTDNVSPQVSYAVNDDTTINTSCSYANPYDHFWFQAAYVTEFSNAGVDYIANTCVFRDDLSDGFVHPRTLIGILN
jgi:endonuclease/exonuclease/phosphatase family metal-dependent hydrolase